MMLGYYCLGVATGIGNVHWLLLRATQGEPFLYEGIVEKGLHIAMSVFAELRPINIETCRYRGVHTVRNREAAIEVIAVLSKLASAATPDRINSSNFIKKFGRRLKLV